METRSLRQDYLPLRTLRLCGATRDLKAAKESRDAIPDAGGYAYCSSMYHVAEFCQHCTFKDRFTVIKGHKE
jgi:hypothetical protein